MLRKLTFYVRLITTDCQRSTKDQDSAMDELPEETPQCIA